MARGRRRSRRRTQRARRKGEILQLPIADPSSSFPPDPSIFLEDLFGKAAAAAVAAVAVMGDPAVDPEDLLPLAAVEGNWDW